MTVAEQYKKFEELDKLASQGLPVNVLICFSTREHSMNWINS